MPTGATGSGKTGLLLSLIGDLAPKHGSLIVDGSIAYVAQTAWIQVVVVIVVVVGGGGGGGGAMNN